MAISVLIGWWTVVTIIGLWFMNMAWGGSTYKEKLIDSLVMLGFAFIVPLIVVKVLPFAQWFLHIIGA